MTEPIDRLAPFKAKGLIGWNDYQALYNLAEDLQSDLNSANAELDELNAWKSGKRGIEDFYALREELYKNQSQLTAHKTALKKCETTLNKVYMLTDYGKQDEDIIKALSEITKLKNQK